MPRPITVRLVGGLGNQLFGYYAGAALAAKHGAPLRLDTSWTRHGITDHGIEILRFDLPGEWISTDSLSARFSAPGTFAGRAWAKAVREIPALRKPLHIYQAPQFGHDPHLLDQPPGTRLRGYFQSWQTVERAIQAGYPRRPRLKQPSIWLERTIACAQDVQPVAVHVRRGDYVKIPQFELLGPAYYEAAIARMRSEGITGPIWLFSDDPAIGRNQLGMFAGEAEMLRSPDGPASELLAMSYAAGHVIANSTFSWWGAWMSEESALVIAPSVWFDAFSDIDDLIPLTWLKQSP